MDLGNGENSTPKRRRQKGSTERGGDMFPVDRISSLPESIISHILSLLPTKSAVVTSFLSKNWRLRWTQIAAFDFDDQHWPPDSEPEDMNFVRFVNLVLASVKDSVHKLRLRWRSNLLRPIYLNIWLNAAIARNIRDLDLSAVPPSGETRPIHSDENFEFGLPIALYTCATLEVLKLRGPFRVKLPHVVSLPKLTALELICVKFECDESVEKLISACPVLHSFIITRCHYHGDLLVCKVSSHSLKSVQIYFEEGCRSCIFADDTKLVIDTPMLEHLVVDSDSISKIICVQREMPVNELEIYSFCESNRPYGDGVACLIKACESVKVMKLWEPTVLALGRGTTPLPATFGRLTKLVVDFTRSHWSNLLELIDRCVNLQVLDITVCEIVHEDDAERILKSLGGSFWRHPVRVPCCLPSSLKHVYIRLFEGFEDEMAMLKFILDHGLLLETVTLCSTHWFLSTADSIDVSEKFNILNKVSMLPRVSATCKVSYS